MSKPKSPPADGADQRKARLAERLRANLQRRKQQARARRAGAADERPEGLLQEDDDAPGSGERPGELP